MKFNAFLIASLITAASAGDVLETEYFDLPSGPDESGWAKNAPSLANGNEVKVSPDDNLVVVTSGDGTISAFTPTDGTVQWSKGPPSSGSGGAPLGRSGVSFSGREVSPAFMAYGVSYGVPDSDNTFCKVILRNYAGDIIAQSADMTGQCAGTPQLGSGSNPYIYINRNQARKGFFTVLERAGASLTPFYDEFSEEQPLGPLGIYLEPNEGYYMGGEGNGNDLLVFALAPYKDEVGVGKTNSYAFQLPLPTNEIGVTLLRNGTFVEGPDGLPRRQLDWQTLTAPTITNDGYSMYWAVSRDQYNAWVGAPGVNNERFEDSATYKTGFSRPSPTWQAPRASLVLSDDSGEPLLFGPTADNLMAAFDFDLNDANDPYEPKWSVAGAAPIYAEARTDGERVYFDNGNGQITSFDNESGGINWGPISVTNSKIPGNFGITSKGDWLFFGDESGNVIGWKVAAAPTDPPTVSPSEMPSAVPSSMPTREPTTPSPTVPGATPAPVTVTDTPAPVAPVDPTMAPIGEQEGTDPPTPTSTSGAATAGVLTVLALVAAAMMV